MIITFAKTIQSLREQAKLSQAQLAKALGTTQRKVSYWETGKIEPDLEMLWKLSDYFDVSIGALVGKEQI